LPAAAAAALSFRAERVNISKHTAVQSPLLGLHSYKHTHLSNANSAAPEAVHHWTNAAWCVRV
jgi:hypothetical protein